MAGNLATPPAPAPSRSTAAASLDSLGYRPGLDGVRGVAILLVLVSHSFLIPSPVGGFAGVTIFFVLSGFLITRLLIDERARDGRINLAAFYARRAVRLLPALLLMLALTLPLRPDEWWSAAWGLSYAGNWWWATGHDPGMYGFTWSLAIEEQFYLVWPAALLLLLGLSQRHRIGVVSIVAVAGMLYGLLPHSAEFRLYATVTNAPALLLGTVLAFTVRDGWHVAGIRLVIGGVAAILVVLLTAGVWGIPFTQEASALFGGLLIVAALRGSLAWRPLVRLGQISYGVYLWNLPVLVLIGAQSGLRGPVVGVVGCAAAVGIAALSFRFVESPMRRRLAEWRRDWAMAVRPEASIG